MASEDKISEAGRLERFARWEELGLDAVKQDLATGGHRLIGGPPQVRELAREWVQRKEAEAASEAARLLSLSRTELDHLMEGAKPLDAQAVLRALGIVPAPPLEDALSGRGPAVDEALRLLGVAPSSAPAITQKATAPAAPAAAQEKQVELLTLKPTIYGVGIDLKEAARRLRKLFKKT